MKVNAVSLTSFRSQNTQKDNNTSVNPYLYTAMPTPEKRVNEHSFRIFLGTLATFAVGLTLYKIFGKKIL